MKTSVLRNLLLMASGISLVACGGGTSSSSSSGGSSGSTEAVVSSLSDVPSEDSMISGGATSTSLSAKSVGKAVSGTPPLLTSITGDSAKSLFWKSGNSNLVDIINTAGTATEAQQESFWRQEGSCRMAQMVGYSMQNLKQAGTSSCYMRNAPDALGADAVTAADGAQALTTPSEIFNKQSGDVIVKVNPTNMPGEEESDDSQQIFIKVYGTDSLEDDNDYHVDLWFCEEGSSTPTGYEQLRYDSSAGTLTKSMVDTAFGTFSASFSANVTEDADGNPIFDTTADRVAQINFSATVQSVALSFKEEVRVSGSQLIARAYDSQVSQAGTSSFKNYAVSTYTGSDISDVRFLQAGYQGEFSFDAQSDSYEGATEYQDDHYEAMELASLDDAALLATVQAHTIADDTFYASGASIDTSALATFDCSATPTYTVVMDFSIAAMDAVADLCENDFSDMGLCDSEAVRAAREVIWTSQEGQQQEQGGGDQGQQGGDQGQQGGPPQ